MMVRHNWTNDWFRGPGCYFWSSDIRLVDLELGYCATPQELEQAIQHHRIDLGWENQEMGGLVYRTHPSTEEAVEAWRMSIAPLTGWSYRVAFSGN
ncbi:MAG: hypothetical protein HQL98_06680 [Magnetococcales bacterium]|nr:hypothetical protein [Magnetococcales bacterium]